MCTGCKGVMQRVNGCWQDFDANVDTIMEKFEKSLVIRTFVLTKLQRHKENRFHTQTLCLWKVVKGLVALCINF